MPITGNSELPAWPEYKGYSGWNSRKFMIHQTRPEAITHDRLQYTMCSLHVNVLLRQGISHP